LCWYCSSKSQILFVRCLHVCIMMKIPFISISSLVPLIEDLYCSDSISFRVHGFTITSFALLLRKEKHVKRKKQIWISSRLLAYIYTCVLCTHIRIYICRDLVHLDSQAPGPPSVSSRPLGSHRAAHVQCVCVRACTNTYTHVHSHPPQKKKDTRQHFYLSFC